MPSPVAQLVGGVVAPPGFGMLAGSLFTGVVGQLLTSAAAGVNLWTAQQGLWAVPAMIPGPEALIEAYQRGFLKRDEDWSDLMRLNGVGRLKNRPAQDRAWAAVMRANRPHPGPPDVIGAYLRGFLTDDVFARLWEQTGASGNDWDWLLQAQWNVLSPWEAIQAWLRGLVKDEDLERMLKHNAVGPASVREMMKIMGTQLPPPSDVIRWAVREAFNEEQVKNLDLDAEYEENPQLPEIAKAVGIGQAQYVNSKGECKTIDVPRMEWRAHWQLPSPGQAYEALRRLRPNRIIRFQQTLPPELAKDLRPFTGNDLIALLKADDYAPKWRPMLSALSYLPLTRIDARRLFQARLIEKAELAEQYLDQGYVKADAEKMADWAEQERDFRHTWPLIKRAAAAALKGFKSGWLSAEAAAPALHKALLLSRKDVLDYEAHPPAVQLQIALGDQRVMNQLALVENELRQQVIDLGVKTVQDRVYGGMIDLNQARLELRTVGLNQQRLEHWLAVWRLKLSGPRRTFALRQLLQFFREGSLSPGELFHRARNLGYGEKDVQVLLASVQINVRKALAKAQAEQARTLDKQKAAQAKAVREVERELEKERKRLLWKTTPKTWSSWLRQNRISVETFRRLLVLAGHKPAEIELLVEDAQGE